MSWQRLEIFKMLLTSFFPLAVMIVAVLGSIVFGLATPTEAAAVGGFGGLVLAARLPLSRGQGKRHARIRSSQQSSDLGGIIKESSFLTEEYLN